MGEWNKNFALSNEFIKVELWLLALRQSETNLLQQRANNQNVSFL